MTPQYSTIRRFDLLCVLKDFIEEYSGDIDSGGVDLNVTFSIVGENPEGADQGLGMTDLFINTQNLPINLKPKPRTNYGPDQIPRTFGG